MIKIIDPLDIELAVPLLADLRSTLDATTFRTRLNAALEGGYRVLGAEQNGIIIGVLGFRFVHDICWGKTCYIDDLNVAADARGAGIGGLLLQAAKDRARKSDCDHIRLCSGLTRADAHRFYEAHDLRSFSKQFVIALKED
ncbi:GNAT family N-acetyltransferase [Yoonia sp. I 8.24]|uniref:GNAT family N-acetyltransferase n=1 Tax=Yoonia sp. I 8.24 TaxID=1537229 RepID=UPI001EDD1751|nr:GNAT family N-acetyltransferase [Yoonia sp. I 8.24]MCG3266679.1 GNAT family N-acetyltransferase [Yoonia sp. I 8.24]